MDCNYTFSIGSAPNGILFGTKNKRKSVTTIQIWFGLTIFRINFMPWGPSRKKDNNRIVQETSFSLHHGGPIYGTPETLGTSQPYDIEGFKQVLSEASIMEGNIMYIYIYIYICILQVIQSQTQVL